MVQQHLCGGEPTNSLSGSVVEVVEIVPLNFQIIGVNECGWCGRRHRDHLPRHGDLLWWRSAAARLVRRSPTRLPGFDGLGLPSRWNAAVGRLLCDALL